MKYAFMSFSCPELELSEMLALAARTGYDGIELRIGGGHKHGVELDSSAEQRRHAREQAASSGVELCCVSTSCKYADPSTVQQQVEDTLRSIDLAGNLGAPVVRVFGGRIPEGVTREQAIHGVAAALGAVADRATERGVTVCLETHDDWCDPDHVADVVRQVDSDAIAVNWDVLHPVRTAGKTMDQAFETLRLWIRHVHFHDGSMRDDKLEYKSLGEGDFDNRRAVQLLRAAGYDGYLSGEWINWEPYETHLPRELAVMKRYEQEA